MLSSVVESAGLPRKSPATKSCSVQHFLYKRSNIRMLHDPHGSAPRAVPGWCRVIAGVMPVRPLLLRRTRRPEAPSMRHPCDIKATSKRVDSQAVGTQPPPTPKPPSCDPKASRSEGRWQSTLGSAATKDAKAECKMPGNSVAQAKPMLDAWESHRRVAGHTPLPHRR